MVFTQRPRAAGMKLQKTSPTGKATSENAAVRRLLPGAFIPVARARRRRQHHRPGHPNRATPPPHPTSHCAAMSLLCRPAPPPADVQLPPPAARFAGHAPSTASTGRSPRRSRAQHGLRRPRAQGIPRPSTSPARAPRLAVPRAAGRTRRRPHSSADRTPRRTQGLLRRPHAPPAAVLAGPRAAPAALAEIVPSSTAGRRIQPRASRIRGRRGRIRPRTPPSSRAGRRPPPLSMASAPAICFEGEEGKEGMGCSPPPPSRGPAGLPASPSGGGEVGRRGGGGGDCRGRGSPPESPYAKFKKLTALDKKNIADGTTCSLAVPLEALRRAFSLPYLI